MFRAGCQRTRAIRAKAHTMQGAQNASGCARLSAKARTEAGTSLLLPPLPAWYRRPNDSTPPTHLRKLMNEPERCCGRPSERARCLVEGTPVARAVYCAPRSTAPAVRGGARGGRDEGGATRKAGALRAGEAPRGEPRAAAAHKQTTERKRETRCAVSSAAQAASRAHWGGSATRSPRRAQLGPRPPPRLARHATPRARRAATPADTRFEKFVPRPRGNQKQRRLPPRHACC